VNHEDQEGHDADDSGGVDLEGGLMAMGGRTSISAVRPPLSRPRYRLKRSLQPFSASDGALYLLRSGAGEDFVLPNPSRFERALIGLLARGFHDQAALEGQLAADGLPAGDLGDALTTLDELGLLAHSAEAGLLSEAERRRYDRQLIYFGDLAAPGVPAERLQRRLREATVVVLGCGGLGSWVACGLACAGIGKLVLIDDDRVELSNLNRQLLFGEADIGRPKVVAAAAALSRHNSGLCVEPVRRRVRGPEDLQDLLTGADLVIATADWPPFELPRWVNQSCLESAVPYIGAGQFPPLVRVGPMVIPGVSACLECLERAARRDYPLYGELTGARVADAPPAATLGAASGLVGSMLAMEAIHLLTGGSRPASIDCALIVDLRSMALTREPVQRDPDCPCCRNCAR
jgi:bacteriocin biosynthesis cyclodehydratase domain-containing protein